MPILYLSFPLEGEFLKLYAFSQSHKASLSFIFSRTVPWVAKVCVPSPNPDPADLGWFSSQACLLSVKTHSCHPRVHMRSIPWQGVWMRHLEHWGCPSVEEVYSQSVISGGWAGFLMGFMKRVVESVFLWWILSPACFASSFFQPFSCADHLSILGGTTKKWAFWSGSYMANKPMCSHTTLLLLGRNCRLRGSLLVLCCAALGERWHG